MGLCSWDKVSCDSTWPWIISVGLMLSVETQKQKKSQRGRGSNVSRGLSDLKPRNVPRGWEVSVETAFRAQQDRFSLELPEERQPHSILILAQ